MSNQKMIERDLKYIFHPCSQMKDYEQNLPLIPIARGSGAYLYDFDDNRYLDAISSWWVNLFGHANSTI
ncbi:MAG TPA: aminotransferase class III-fold pyridoxal phosphate-dependent enzyme, partial [Nitratifractor sp.]|nr:aminotransferase class III-fold pyridoxal phosphate-dependent enzyme [Nitratifractor sp.]